jgi:hypothetical protein
MGYFFDNEIHSIDGNIVTTLRKVPISGGSLSRILLPGFYDITKWRRHFVKEWGRRWYSKSKRCIIIYRLSTLIDGVYEIQSVSSDADEDGTTYYEYIAWYFEMKNGEISLLDNANQAHDRLRAARGQLDYTIADIRRKHGYSEREIDFMLQQGRITPEGAQRLREERYELDRQYLAETTPAATLP